MTAKEQHEQKDMTINVTFKDGSKKTFSRFDFIVDFAKDRTMFVEKGDDEALSGADWALSLSTTYADDWDDELDLVEKD